jgi:AraC-like DNA-binding protein
MFLTFNERPSDSPFVERIWRSRSHSAGVFLSVAASHFEIAVTRHNGKSFLTVRGPETSATQADCPGGGEWLGIRFKLGTFMPAFLPGHLKDRHDVTLPVATSQSFWLNGSAWEYPDFENADTFVARLVRKGIIVRDAGVEAALQGQAGRLPIRSIQRHFLRATGISHRAARQIERARYATTLLKRGVSILDTVHEAGYFDQAHLNRAVKILIGQTPLEIRNGQQQLSFLYKTTPLPPIYDAHRRFAHDRIGTNHGPG